MKTCGVVYNFIQPARLLEGGPSHWMQPLRCFAAMGQYQAIWESGIESKG